MHESNGRPGPMVGRAWKVIRIAVLPVAVIVAMGAAENSSSQPQQEFSLRGDHVRVYNLAGSVEIVPGSGSAVQVEVDMQGPDASELDVRMVEVDGDEALVVFYPEDEIVYRRGGSNSRSTSTFNIRDDGVFGRNGDRRVTVRTFGNGLEAHANLRISVPAGRTLSVDLGVGEVEGADVDGDLDVDTSTGGVVLSNIGGSVSVDTGSGDVEVRGVGGSLNVDTGSGDVIAGDVGDGAMVDTGSGDVTVTGVSGSVSVDTGSGGVEVADASGGDIMIDTGSGDVELDDVTIDQLDIDTGSGSVNGVGVSVDEIGIDIASGAVDLELTSDFRSIDIDTSSGRVTLRLPNGVGADLDLETRSGGIDIDIPAEVRESSRRRFRGRIGDGAGEVVIETGSGGIRIMRN